MQLVEAYSMRDYIWPNPLVVEIGDEILGRKGTIIEGVQRWRDAQDTHD